MLTPPAVLTLLAGLLVVVLIAGTAPLPDARPPP